jgi:hypothetical protein
MTTKHHVAGALENTTHRVNGYSSTRQYVPSNLKYVGLLMPFSGTHAITNIIVIIIYNTNTTVAITDMS